MGSKTSIEWAANVDGSPGATWNPIRGCSRISEGCRNCYAERMAARFAGDAPYGKPGPFAGFASMTPSGPRWTGRVELVPDALEIPLKRKKPTTYFVNSMSDLFHESLSFEDVFRVLNRIAIAPWHRFIVLTKRASRLPSLLDLYYRGTALPGIRTPLRNLILGVSCEDQAAADERIPNLLATPAACRMVSLEPLLGPIDLYHYLPSLPGSEQSCCYQSHLDWVIAGGESGPGARPMHPDWARQVRDGCDRKAVPFFFKQNGEWLSVDAARDILGDDDPRLSDGQTFQRAALKTIGSTKMVRVGKKAAGRLLDGRVWDERPEVLR